MNEKREKICIIKTGNSYVNHIPKKKCNKWSSSSSHGTHKSHAFSARVHHPPYTRKFSYLTALMMMMMMGIVAVVVVQNGHEIFISPIYSSK